MNVKKFFKKFMLVIVVLYSFTLLWDFIMRVLLNLGFEINFTEVISFILSIILYILVYKKIRKMKYKKTKILKQHDVIIDEKKQREIDKIQNDRNIIMRNSPKCIKALELIETYNEKVKKYSNSCRMIKNREYSNKSFDNQTFEEVLKYNIENNIENLRDDIALIEENKRMYDKVIIEINQTESLPQSQITELGFEEEEFKRIEKRLVLEIISMNMPRLTVDIQIYMQSKYGNVYREKHNSFSNKELLKFYEEWKEKPKYKKYEVSANFERKELNRSLRFAVLKRDNYRCCICGRDVKDGVKLEIDHIVPVSKGGKTVITNLQTLCQDCNHGKWSRDM